MLRRGKNARKSAVYTTVHEHFESIFNDVSAKRRHFEMGSSNTTRERDQLLICVRTWRRIARTIGCCCFILLSAGFVQANESNTLETTIPQTDKRYQQQRAAMVQDQIVQPSDGRTAVTNKNVLAAMREVPRHWFVPKEYARTAYHDGPLPIGHGQTISQPYIVAIMTELLKPQSDHIVLEVGTGSGYQAAILSQLVQQVYTIEIVEPLGEEATQTLSERGYDNVEVRVGDGYQGWPEQAPFDGIIVTAAPDHVPQPLIDQLRTGGRMVIPVGPSGGIQELLVLTKQEDGSISETEMMSVRFVPLTRDND